MVLTNLEKCAITLSGKTDCRKNFFTVVRYQGNTLDPVRPARCCGTISLCSNTTKSFLSRLDSQTKTSCFAGRFCLIARHLSALLCSLINALACAIFSLKSLGISISLALLAKPKKTAGLIHCLYVVSVEKIFFVKVRQQGKPCTRFPMKRCFHWERCFL